MARASRTWTIGLALAWGLLGWYDSGVVAAVPARSLQLGIDVLLTQGREQLRGKRVGLVTNQAAVDAHLQATADRLAMALPTVGGRLVALFAPEHGLRGDRPAGQTVPDEVDPGTGVPVYSLYGSTREPSPAQLAGLDLLVIDLPDIGWRHYTYISTMVYVLRAAAKAHVPVVVTDRPNPLGGLVLEGPVAEPDFLSFVGIYPIPLRHGMTIGELARFFNQEYRLGADLTVIPMQGWSRSMLWSDTGLPWVAPSPQIPTPEAALLFGLGGVLGETANLSDGVGTAQPFSYLGAEWIDPFRLATAANRLELPGLYFRPTYIVPSGYRFAGRRLGAVQVHVVDATVARPAAAGIQLLALLQQLWPGRVQFPAGQRNMFDLVVGTDRIRRSILEGRPATAILQEDEPALSDFARRRQPYLLYPR